MDILFKLIAGSILLVLFGESSLLILHLWSDDWVGWTAFIYYLLMFLGMSNVHIYAYIIVTDLYKNPLIYIGICLLFCTIIMALSPASLDTEFDNNYTINIILTFIPLLFTLPIMRDEIKRIILND